MSTNLKLFKMRKIILLFFSACLFTVQAQIPTDTYFNFPLNGNAYDCSGNNLQGTIIGGVTPTTDRFGNPTGAMAFDGTSSYIDIPYSNSVDTSNFSVSYWAKPTDFANNGFVLSKQTDYVAANQFRLGGSGTWAATFSDGTDPGLGLACSPILNTWNHYVIVRHGATITSYVNGALDSQGSTTSILDHRNTEHYLIGTYDETRFYYKGSIDELRMFKHALTTTEITAIYNYQNNALAFDGIDDNVSGNLVTTATDNITMEAWVNWRGASSTNQFIVLNGDSRYDGYAIFINNADGNKVNVLCGGVSILKSNYVLTPNEWHHLAIVRENGVFKLYVDTTEVSLTNNTTTPNVPSGNLFIGGSQSLPEHFNGAIDEVRIWNTARSQSELIASMNTQITNPKALKSLLAYYAFNESSAGILVDSTANNNNLTLNNFALNGSTSNWVTGFLPYSSLSPAPSIPEAPVVTTDNVNVDIDNAYISGSFTEFGIPAPTNYGFIWDTQLNVTFKNSNVIDLGVPADANSFGTSITGLNGNTHYFVRAFAINSVDTCYGAIVEFRTLKDPFFYPTGNKIAPSWYYSDIISFSGNYTNPTTGNNGCVIDDAGINYTNFALSDAYDGAFEVFVNIGDSVYTEPGKIDTLGTHFQLSEQKIDSFYVSKSYFFVPTEPVVRAIYKIRNDDDVVRSAKIGTHSNLGSDGDTKLDSCSTGNLTLSDADRWMITSDGNNGLDYNNGDPINTWVRFGTGNIASQPIFGAKPELGSDEYIDTIAVTVPAHSYVLIMQFNRMDSTTTAAKSNVVKFNSATNLRNAGYLAGLSDEELSKIVNWSIPTMTTGTNNFTKPVSMYPNPTNDSFFIEAGEKASMLTVCNLNGIAVLTKTLTGYSSVNVSALQRGVYIVKLNGFVGKLIKK